MKSIPSSSGSRRSIYRASTVVLATSIATTLAAQTAIYGTTLNPKFGREVAVLDDVDGLGRGDLLVAAPGDGTPASPSGSVYIISGESPNSTAATILVNINSAALLNYPANGARFGHALANVGNVDAVDPRDDFAVASPNLTNNPFARGEVHIFSPRTNFNGTIGVALLQTLTGPLGFGTSLEVVPYAAAAYGRALAVGSPGTNQVFLYDPSNGSLLRTLDVQAVTGTLGGSCGTSLAAGPGGLLAAGAPDYISPTGTTPEGYVAIWDLASPSAYPRAFLYRGIAGERLGTAVASVGQLQNNGFSPLSDFATLAAGSNGVNANVYLFHTPNGLMAAPTVTAAQASMPNGIPFTGRMVALGDIDGDGIGDVAATSGGSGSTVLRILSTRAVTPGSNTLTQVTLLAASQNGGLAVGPDLYGMGATDLVNGSPNLTSILGSVTVQPLGTSTLLPNPPTARLDTSSRPLVPSGAYSMTLTGPVGQVGIILASNAPVTPSAIPGGMAYVDMTPNSPNLVTMAIGALPLTANVTMPPNFTYLYQAVIYQGATLDPATNATTPSNGIMARLGSQ